MLPIPGEMQRVVTVLIGIPGSGKTHFLNRGGGGAIFSPDSLLLNTRTKKYVWTRARSAWAWAETYRWFGKWLRYGSGSCAWDATNTKAILRSPLINIAKGYGCRVMAIYFKTPLRTCLARNRQRTPDRRVPEATIRAMHRDLTSPTRSEGFDSIRTIRSRGR